MSRPINFIPFYKPHLGREEEEAVLKVMRSGWLTTGKVAARFEEEFASFVGVKHALAVNSATSGLHLGLESLGVKSNSLVITSPYTFASTAEVIRYMGADPLFIDIEEDTYNLSPHALERALRVKGKYVSAVIPVHIAGLPCKMEAIMAISEEYGIPVIEDSAHAFPVKMGKRMAGTFAELGIYSFYATKPITTGEGGMVVTNREDLSCRIRVMRLHGIDRDVWDRYTDPSADWYYQVVEAGYKYNLSDLAASIGLAQLKKAKNFLSMRRNIVKNYIKGLSGLDFLKLPKADLNGHAWHLFIVKLVETKLTINRNEFVAKLKEEGIGVSVHYIPLHIMPYYRKRYGYREEDFPVSLRNFKVSFSLPVYPGLTGEQVDRIIATVKQIGSRFYR